VAAVVILRRTKAMQARVDTAAVPVTPILSVALSLVAIVVCGVAGAVAGFTAMRLIGVGGVPGALFATVISLVVATLLFALGGALLRKLRWMR
jgi:hypothetical protein